MDGAAVPEFYELLSALNCVLKDLPRHFLPGKKANTVDAQ